MTEKEFIIKDNQTPNATDDISKKIDAEAQKGFNLPTIDFSTFILSLNSSALVHLGKIQEPGTGQMAKNILLAKQTIDILDLLEKKTQGNLLAEELKLLQNILHELRLMFVKETSK